MLTADISLCNFDMGPLARSNIGCAVGGVIPLFSLWIDDEPNE